MIKVLKYTEKPLSFMGEVAGICYGTTNPKAFTRIAKRCLEEGHGRVSEFADVVLAIDGYSAKVIRELYTHIVGTSRLQASTRYIDYSEQFENVMPKSVENNPIAKKIWNNTMETINENIKALKASGVPTEDFTNMLPLSYSTKMVLKIDVRALIHMFHVRACTCAYHEFRGLMSELKLELSKLDEEWKFLCENYFVSKCIANGYCDEKTRHCGIRPLKSEVLNGETK